MARNIDVLRRAFLFRYAGLAPVAGEAVAWEVPGKVILDLANGVNEEFDVAGCYYHSIDLNVGGDTWKVQGDAGLGYRDISGQTGIAADGVRQFTGLYLKLKLVRTAGSGATAKAYAMSRA